MLVRLTVCFLMVIVVSTELIGCASLSDIRQVRELPGMTKPSSNDQFYYDPSIRSYRLKESEKKPGSAEDGKAVRDAVGKKVQTEEELGRIVQSNKREPIGTGTLVATTVLTVVYLPLSIPIGIVEDVIMIPWSLMFSHYQRMYQKEAEESYKLGRQHFANDRIKEALAEWEHARTTMPSLQAFSDIDYWRGRAFEATSKFGEAQIAYLTFINYSERSAPAYFKETFPQDLAWEEKARDAESRISILRRK